MANYSSSGPQVPFGDGSHVPPEQVVEGDVILSETNFHMAMKDIFLSCDVNNTGLVLVSKLIDFVSPFMQHNDHELLELKKALDPHNSNPHINKETFFKVMGEWTTRLMGESASKDELSLSSSTTSEQDRDSLVQLASRSTFGQYMLKGYGESGIQNLSTSSSYSCEGNNVPDLNVLQEQINELEHRNRKLTDELTNVRVQLSNCEEQNDVLQTDVDRLSRKLVSEQQLNGQLQLKKSDSEDLLETSAMAQKQIAKVEKLLATAEKENFQLRQTIESMETEKQQLEDSIEQLVKREEESKRLLLELQSDIDCKENVVSSLEEANIQLKHKIDEQEQIVLHYTDVNERLKMEKVKLEHHFRERLMRSSLSNQSKSPSNSFSEYSTPNNSERTGVASRDKSPADGSPRSSAFDSSEDDMCWKVHMMNLSSPHDSLEQEMVQAQMGRQHNPRLVNKLKSNIQHLELKKTEYEVTVKQLMKDINGLQVQNSKNEKQLNECEEKYKDLLTKFKELEGDNSSKYIKIVNLMEQTENLQKQLSGGDDDKFTQLSLLKKKISELQQDKGVLQQQLQQWDKQNSQTLMQHLQSMKTEYELLRNRLDLSTKAEEAISKEFEKICCENGDLRKQLEFLRETIHELNSEKSKLTHNIQKLSEEYNTVKGEVKAQNVKETEITGKLTKLVNENLELKGKLTSNSPSRTESQVDELESLREAVKQHTATIEKLSKSAEEKKHQISTLKKMVNLQNTNIKSLENYKTKSTNQLYEQKCANDELLEENRSLLEKLDRNEKDKNHLQCQLLMLGDSNKNIQVELENLRGDNKKIKDAHNIMKEYQLLMEEKEVLIKQKDELTNENNLLEGLNNELQQQLGQLEQAREKLSTTIAELNTKLHSADTEINKLTNKLEHLKVSTDQTTSDLMEEIIRLEQTSNSMQSENRKLLSKVKLIKNNYETLLHEKGEWLAEQNRWEQMKEEFTNNLTSAKTEASRLQKQLNEIETSAKSSQDNLSDDEVCKNCVMLKLEVEELNLQVDQLNCDVASLEAEDRNSKRGNFEKLQLKIEKLKVRMEEAEEQLKEEKQRVEALEQTNLKLLQQINDNSKHHNEVKVAIFAEKAALEGKLKEVVEELKHVQNEKQDLEQEKHLISKNSVSLEKKLRDAARLIEERLELMNKENTQLHEEVTDLRIRKTDLEKNVSQLQHDLKAKADLDSKLDLQTKTNEDLLESANKENAQLQLEVTDLHKHKISLEKQLDKLQNDLREKIDFEEKYKAEAKIKEDLLDSINRECVQLQQELEIVNNQKISLERKLEKTQNDLQKSETKNLSIRKMLTDVRSSVSEGYDAVQENVEALLKERDSEVNILQQQLKNYENELANVKLELSESNDSLNTLSEHVVSVNRNLAEKRHQLNRSVVTLTNTWHTVLEDSYDLRTIVEALLRSDNSTEHSTENPTAPLDEEITKLRNQIQLVSQFLDTLGTIKMSTATRRNTDTASCHQPCSPFSNSRFVKKVTLKTTTTAISLRSETSLAKATQTEDNYAHSEDEADESNISSTPENPQNPTPRVEDIGHNAALEIASPGLSDSVMENLHLDDSDDSSEGLEMKMEEKYEILAAAFMINISTIKNRYQQQQNQQITIENDFSTESEKLVTTLTTMQDLDIERHLDKHITTCLQQVNSIVGMFARTSVLAMQYGALLHEQRLLKCVILMISYTTHLRQVIEKATLQLKCIRSTSLNPKPKPLCMLASNSSNLSVLSVRSANHSRVDYNISKNSKEIDENVAVLRLDRRPLHMPRQLLRRAFGRFVNRDADFGWFWLSVVFLFVAMIAAVAVRMRYSNNLPYPTTYPWQWVSWNDIFAPYVKKTYLNGPPPV